MLWSFLLHSFGPSYFSSSFSLFPTLQHLNVNTRKDSAVSFPTLGTPPFYLFFDHIIFLPKFEIRKREKEKKKEKEKRKFFEHTKPDSSINFTVFIFRVVNALSLCNLWLVSNIKIALEPAASDAERGQPNAIKRRAVFHVANHLELRTVCNFMDCAKVTCLISQKVVAITASTLVQLEERKKEMRRSNEVTEGPGTTSEWRRRRRQLRDYRSNRQLQMGRVYAN